jgi:Raf kinase inhibitor-like YbhB/YbcL family protein
MGIFAELTGGRFRIGALARVLIMAWTTGLAPTFEEFARAWIAAKAEPRDLLSTEYAYLTDPVERNGWSRMEGEEQREGRPNAPLPSSIASWARDTHPSEPIEGGVMIEVRSPAFSEGDTLPVEFTFDGDNVSPPLSWSGVPEGTVELRISVRDPDAPSGTFTHWLVVRVDPASTDVGRGTVPARGTEERNSFGDDAYGGPCPPRGHDPHRYVFTVEALDAVGNVLASGTLTTMYGR